MRLSDIEACGIIGAGGAGFPAHVKLNSRPDTLIVNAAECEPLLHKDMEIILHHSDTVLEGLRVAMEVTGAREAIIGIKEKHEHEIALLAARVPANVRVMPIEDVYPAGDEVTLIYMTTRRIVAPGALPISVGCVVQNVETMYNIGAGVPVVEKFIAVAGAVEQPATVRVPVGTTFADVLSRFTITEPGTVVRSGGLMMGALETDLQKVVSRRTGALIVLPADHHCVTMYRRFMTDHDTDRIAKAGCDQCSFCTELCPRYLLGQPVRPETAMRNRMFTQESEPVLFAGNASCCECNLCTMYSCPEGLDPRGAAVIEKRLARAEKLEWAAGAAQVHPMYEYRKVPTHKLKQRLDVLRFKDEGPLKEFGRAPAAVRVPLREHLGAPAEPVVGVGERVRRGGLIGRAAGTVSSNVHASIDGVVTRVTADEIVLEKA
jgi:Na+-translocating ferredoxin:NAD+ oxidoreductase RnfC subunit